LPQDLADAFNLNATQLEFLAWLHEFRDTTIAQIAGMAECNLFTAREIKKDLHALLRVRTTAGLLSRVDDYLGDRQRRAS